MANRISVSTLVRYIKNQLDKDTYLIFDYVDCEFYLII